MQLKIKVGLNKMMRLTIVISLLANAMTGQAGSLLSVFIKGYHTSIIAGHTLNTASMDGGMAFLIVLGIGYGANKFIDPLFKHKEDQKNTKADKLLNSGS